MFFILWNYCTILLITAIYYGWKGYRQSMLKRKRLERERVTYMLWVMANEVMEDNLEDSDLILVQ